MNDVINVADAILRLAKAQGQALTPMQLVKLCYIAHGWSLALRGRPLFRNRIEAWQYGPVIPDLYHITKPYGRNPIPLNAIDTDGITGLSAADNEFVKKVFDQYGHFDGIKLSWMTHRPGTPWSQIRNPPLGVRRENIIPDELIERHYRELYHARRG